jgi:prephenate dehydrogenase
VVKSNISKMKILIAGAGRMGSWLVESLCLEHDVAVYDKDKSKLRYLFNAHRITTPGEVLDFRAQLFINAVSLQYTRSAFDELLPLLPKDCIITDITSVKNGLKSFYEKSGMRYVSTHPMFGPTFANIKELSKENAIIIREGDEEGKNFFRNFYASFNLRIHEYSFEEHDQTIAYSLSIPFSSTMVFASVMKTQDAPGTTFKKHMAIAKGLFTEDDFLLSEILLNPFTLEQVENIHQKLDVLIQLIRSHDVEGLHAFIGQLRKNINEH